MSKKLQFEEGEWIKRYLKTDIVAELQTSWRNECGYRGHGSRLQG